MNNKSVACYTRAERVVDAPAQEFGQMRSPPTRCDAGRVVRLSVGSLLGPTRCRPCDATPRRTSLLALSVAARVQGRRCEQK
eukprot:6447103-Pyramimonas_sp.AAC.1